MIVTVGRKQESLGYGYTTSGHRTAIHGAETKIREHDGPPDVMRERPGQVSERSGDFLKCSVDNPLVEARMHSLHHGDEIVYHEDHILAIHHNRRQEVVAEMDAADLKELAKWLASLRQ